MTSTTPFTCWYVVPTTGTRLRRSTWPRRVRIGQQPCRTGDVGIDAGGDRGRGHDLRCHRLDCPGDPPPGESAGCRLVLLRQQVCFGHDADDPFLAVDHRDGADVVLGQQRRRAGIQGKATWLCRDHRHAAVGGNALSVACAGCCAVSGVMAMTVTDAPTRQWSVAHAGRMLHAASVAPRWGVVRPWVLELRGDSVLIHESPATDRHGSDRRLSCGAVLTNVRLAIRTADHLVTVRFLTDRDRPDLVAELTAGGSLPATRTETDQYAVIESGRRGRASDSADVLDTVMSAVWCPGVEVRPLVRGHDRRLGDREFLVLTVDDGRLDGVLAGAAVQSASVAATAAGLIVHPPVNLHRVPEFRAGLIESLMLAGYPQVLLRVGAQSRWREV